MLIALADRPIPLARSLRRFFLLAAFIMISTTASSFGQAGDSDEMSGHEHQHPDQNQAEQAGTGLDPRDGETLPLDLAFTDADGKEIRLDDLLEGPTLILPVYYRCPNVCTFLQASVAEVLGDVAHEPDKDYQVVSISFNDREGTADAQKARRTYQSIAGRDFPEEAWRFLTGETEAINAFFDAAGYQFQRQGEEFLHPMVSFVVTGEGKIIRYLYGTRPLPKDLTLAFYEAQSGRSGATIRKVVEFCFSYDRESQTYAVNLLRISATVILLCIGIFVTYLLLSGKKKKDRKA
ncbi:MAG: SCO family protein [Desulfuromonadales bacterium]